jgi:hypothetical protein
MSQREIVRAGLMVAVVAVALPPVGHAVEVAAGAQVDEAPQEEAEAATRERRPPHRLGVPPWLTNAATEEESAASLEVVPAHFRILNMLSRWWMPNLGDGDHMSTILSTEQPNYGGDTFEGQMFYIPGSPSEDTTTLYRLSSVPLQDHMDSLQTNEGGYALEGTLGYPFTSQQPGTAPITRWRSVSPYDHMTARVGEWPTGYTEDGPLGYGYPRLPVNPAQHCTENFTAQGQEVQTAFSKIAGGTVWELWWNGKQFVNDWEYGRQIQSALFWAPGDVNNPTEGGDTMFEAEPECTSLGPWAHGSPLLSYSVTTPDGVGPVVTTTTQPINFYTKPYACPNPGEPCDPNHPLLWNGTFTKTVTLNSQGRAKRVKWKVDTNYPADLPCNGPMAHDCVMMGIAASHLTDEFSTIYAFNAMTHTLTLIPQIPDNEYGYCLWPNGPHNSDPVLKVHPAGGVIGATPNGRYALGIYHKDEDGFDNDNTFAVCAWQHGDGGQYGTKTFMPQVYHVYHDGVTAGTYSNTVYLVVGKLVDVEAEMIALYDSGL